MLPIAKRGVPMVDVFISYSRSDKEAVGRLAKKIESEGYKVWWDAELPPHKSYGEVITAKIEDAKAAIVVWSPEAAKSEWVRAEADMARNYRKLVQTALGDIIPPLPFNQIQFADIGDWQGEDDHPGWAKVMVSLRELCGEREPIAAASAVGAEPAPVVPPAPTPAPAPAPDAVAASPKVADSNPEPTPVQNFAAATPGSGSGQPSSSPKWPIFAGLGCAGLASLVTIALVMIGAGTSEEAAEAPPIALVGPSGGDAGSGAGPSESDTSGNPGSTPPTLRTEPQPQTQPQVQAAPASQTFTGALNQGASATHMVNLNAGMSYMIVAGCDVDCSDIDMQIYDENGNMIDEDVLDDDVPVLEVTPIRNAQFRLEIGMYACSIAPCGYQINVEGN